MLDSEFLFDHIYAQKLSDIAFLMSIFSTSVDMAVSFPTNVGEIVSGGDDGFIPLLSGMSAVVVICKRNRHKSFKL